MCGNNITSPQQSDPRIQNLLQRIFILRRRFKAVLPGSLEMIKSSVIEDNLDSKTSDVIYLLGVMIARQGEPITMGEISRVMDVPMSTATRLVDWFVRHEYAMRLPDLEDRRIVRITLTETGQAAYQAIQAFMLERVEKLMSNFTTEERDQFANLLAKMVDSMEIEE